MAKWYEDSGFQSDIVLSTRVRLARNIKGIPFPGKMSEDDAIKVIGKTEDALSRVNMEFTKTDILSLSPLKREQLVEKRFISPNFAKSRHPSVVFQSGDESVSIMVNEEDHLRLQAIFAGFECDKAHKMVSNMDKILSESLDYAVHEKYGYLTSCLTNVGTGIRISFMMHLPAICKAQIADSLFSAIGKLGVTVRGMYGEGSKASGYLFQISNQMTLGLNEKEIADRMTDVASKLISKERELRASLYKSEGLELEDKIMRSLGLVKNARLMSTKEMLTLFSNIRFGMSLGLIENIEPRQLNLLMVETSPAHLAEGRQDPKQRDVERARLIREKLC